MSEPHSTPRNSAYLDALSQAIHKKLQKALANSSQRRNLLQELFADIALEVDDRAKDVILNKEEDDISPAEDINDGPICFYDVLADYFVRESESGKPILDLIVQLWSQSFASHIFALLFHKWRTSLWSPVGLKLKNLPQDHMAQIMPRCYQGIKELGYDPFLENRRKTSPRIQDQYTFTFTLECFDQI